MKRELTLKVVWSLAVVFTANSLFAQIPAVFDPISGNSAVAIDSVTVGTTTPYWVEPDSYYHPNFASTGALTANFTWTWAVAPAGPTMSATNNYVEIAWPAQGLFNVTVFETAPAAMGGCSSADTNAYVRVIASPTVGFTADNPGTIIGANLNVCESDTRLNDIVQASITTVAGATPQVQLEYTYEVETEDAGGTTTQQSINEFLFTAGNQVTGINTATYNLMRPAGGYAVIGGETTIYTYTISGVTDRISRKSDYLVNPTGANTGWRPYDTTTETIVITVNPTPVTGPIYTIPNNWAN